MTWLFRLLPVAKAVPWSLVMRVVLIGAVLLAIPAAMWAAYRVGAEGARAECAAASQEALIEALERQAELDRQIREADFELLMDAVRVETRTIRDIRYIVAEPVATPGCPRLGDDWLRQYNAITRAIGAAASAGIPD